MSIHVAVRASYPEQGNYDWYESLATYRAIGAVEVAFYRPELFLQNVTLEDVAAPFSTLPIAAISIHMAQARIGDFDAFVRVLRKTLALAQALGCSLVVAHPTEGRLAEVEGKIAAVVDPLLAEAGVTLCWETFGGKRRFLSGIEGIAAFCCDKEHQGRVYHAACYDTSHLHKPQAEVLADIADYADCVRCFHLSNRGAGGEAQHLPLRHPDGVPDFKEILAAIARSGFAGPLTLEYLPQHHDQLPACAGTHADRLPDGLWVADWRDALQGEWPVGS